MANSERYRTPVKSGDVEGLLEVAAMHHRVGHLELSRTSSGLAMVIAMRGLEKSFRRKPDQHAMYLYVNKTQRYVLDEARDLAENDIVFIWGTKESE